MSNPSDIHQQLLLSYIGLLAERHSYGPGDNFEYKLWDDLRAKRSRLVSSEERKELVGLITKTEKYIAFNIDTGMFQLIDLDAWNMLLSKRDH